MSVEHGYAGTFQCIPHIDSIIVIAGKQNTTYQIKQKSNQMQHIECKLIKTRKKTLHFRWLFLIILKLEEF